MRQWRKYLRREDGVLSTVVAGLLFIQAGIVLYVGWVILHG